MMKKILYHFISLSVINRPAELSLIVNFEFLTCRMRFYLKPTISRSTFSNATRFFIYKMGFWKPLCFTYFSVLGIELSVLGMLDKHSITGLYLQLEALQFMTLMCNFDWELHITRWRRWEALSWEWLKLTFPVSGTAFQVPWLGCIITAGCQIEIFLFL